MANSNRNCVVGYLILRAVMAYLNLADSSDIRMIFKHKKHRLFSNITQHPKNKRKMKKSTMPLKACQRKKTACEIEKGFEEKVISFMWNGLITSLFRLSKDRDGLFYC